IFLNDSGVEFGVDTVVIDWNASDEFVVFREANVSFPNGTLLQRLTADTEDFTLTSNNLSVTGTYNIRVFTNDSAGNVNLTNVSFTVSDTTPANVTLVTPANNSYLNRSTFNISCNTSDKQLKNVSLFHNISGSFVLNQSVNVSGTVNVSNFTLTGARDVGFVWNCLVFDISGNQIFAQSNFSLTVDTTRPNITVSMDDAILEFNIENMQIDWNVSDVNTQFMEANVSFPNGTLLQRLTDDTVDFNLTPSNLSVTGTYAIRFFANDSAGNRNVSFTTFNVSRTNVTLVTPSNGSSSTASLHTFRCNASASDVGLINLSFFHNVNGSFVFNQSRNVSGMTNESEFNLTGIPDMSFVWNCLAVSTTNVGVFALTNFTFTKAAVPASPGGGGRGGGGGGGGGACMPDWSCAEWNECHRGFRTRVCTDEKNCGKDENKPTEQESCNCFQEWACSEWTACKDEVQTRACEKAPGCYKGAPEPKMSRSCKEAVEELLPVAPVQPVQPVLEVPAEEKAVPPQLAPEVEPRVEKPGVILQLKSRVSVLVSVVQNAASSVGSALKTASIAVVDALKSATVNVATAAADAARALVEAAKDAGISFVQGIKAVPSWVWIITVLAVMSAGVGVVAYRRYEHEHIHDQEHDVFALPPLRRIDEINKELERVDSTIEKTLKPAKAPTIAVKIKTPSEFEREIKRVERDLAFVKKPSVDTKVEKIDKQLEMFRKHRLQHDEDLTRIEKLNIDGKLENIDDALRSFRKESVAPQKAVDVKLGVLDKKLESFRKGGVAPSKDVDVKLDVLDEKLDSFRKSASKKKKK
ncbi:hypothetical protein HZB03_01080, partial [Candidatus Woesearchaeota archaeon]|nr:hypothetical protein [Candidatus Woesearchaeota archaeon]